MITIETWQGRALKALGTARSMSESIAMLATAIQRGELSDLYPACEAVLACTDRLNAAVDPVTEEIPQ